MDNRQKRLSSWQQQQAPVAEVQVTPTEVINIVMPVKAPVVQPVVELPVEPVVEPESPVDIVADVLAGENPKVNNLKKLKKD